MDSPVLREFGADAEEQFDAYLRHDPQLSDWGVTAKRISPVVKYTNYQLRHTRGVGPRLGAASATRSASSIRCSRAAS